MAERKKKIPKEILDQYPKSPTSRNFLVCGLALECDLKNQEPNLKEIKKRVERMSDKEVENELQAVIKRTR